MLKQHRPGKFRRTWGSLAVMCAVLLATGGVYAATQPAAQTAAAKQADVEQHYTLKLVVGIGNGSPRYHGIMCLKPGKFFDVTEGGLGKQPPWHGRFTVVPAEKGMLEVQTTMSGGGLANPINPKVRLLPGQEGGMVLDVGHNDKNGKAIEDGTITINLTPSIGC